MTNGFQDSAWHTDGHTDEGDSKGPSTDGRETKNERKAIGKSNLPNLPKKKVRVPLPLSDDMKKLEEYINTHADFKGKSGSLKKYKCRMREAMKDGKSLEDCHTENKQFIR